MVVTTTSVILNSNKIPNADILVPASTGCPGKWRLNKCCRYVKLENEQHMLLTSVVQYISDCSSELDKVINTNILSLGCLFRDAN